jgi:hypothetical protein
MSNEYFCKYCLGEGKRHNGYFSYPCDCILSMGIEIHGMTVEESKSYLDALDNISEMTDNSWSELQKIYFPEIKPITREDNEQKVLNFYNEIESYRKQHKGFDSDDYLEGQRYAIVQTLYLLGIKIEGVND